MTPRRRLILAVVAGMAMLAGLVVAPAVRRAYEDWLYQPHLETGPVPESQTQQIALQGTMPQLRTGISPQALLSDGADDAPADEGDYYATRLNPEANPFDRDAPPSGKTLTCFTGRVGGKTQHVTVLNDGVEVVSHDPESLEAWRQGGCNYALLWEHHLLSTNGYLRARLALLPDHPAYDAERIALKARIRFPWF